jgi:hypothetical protein
MGAGLPNVSMAPKVNASSSRRGATAVFKSVLHVWDRSLDKPGHGNVDPLGRGPSVYGAVSGWSAVCGWFGVVCGVVTYSDGCWAAKCQHGTQSERLQQ